MPTFPRDSSPSLKAHVKQSERLMLTAYFDVAGVPTIGWGHIAGVTAADVRRGRTITEAQALAFFEADLDIAEQAVRRLVKVDLNQYQFDALVDFVFNLGEGNFASSTLLKKLNAGDYLAVPGQLMRWTKARDPKTGKLRELRGLVIRRQWEADLWNRVILTPLPAPYDASKPEATVIPAPTRQNTSLLGLILTFLFNLIGGLRRVQPV